MRRQLARESPEMEDVSMQTTIMYAQFLIGVRRTNENFRAVAEPIGCERASTIEAFHQPFDFRLTEAVRRSGEPFAGANLHDQRQRGVADGV